MEWWRKIYIWSSKEDGIKDAESGREKKEYDKGRGKLEKNSENEERFFFFVLEIARRKLNQEVKFLSLRFIEKKNLCSKVSI